MQEIAQPSAQHPQESNGTTCCTRARRSDHLLDVLSDFERIVVVTHDHPDPDALAAGWAVVFLVQSKLRRPAQFIAGGTIVRAENRRMIDLLGPPIQLVDRLGVSRTEGIVLVDCSPNAVNHVIGGETSIQPVAVIDHHEQNGKAFRVRHRDVRSDVAASATILTEYLQEQALEPPPVLATALLYGIHTDAQGWPAYHQADHQAVSWLTPRADLNELADIRSAPLPQEYYADLLMAIESTFTYGGAALCFRPRASGPEIVGEIGDLLIRCEHIHQVLCGAVIEGRVLISVRTAADDGDAAALVNKVLAGLGHGGGHRHRAGGKIAVVQKNGRISADLQTELRNRWLRACGVDQHRGRRLVARGDILGNL